uniref:Periphilin-1 C-terminal domain-containing protein n=1 Tax=Plectus sambesii TaxID=2011161 RepID=A0A914VH41_9BILA
MLPDLCADDNLLLRVQVALSMHLLQIAKNNNEPLPTVVQAAAQSARSNLKLSGRQLVRLPLTSVLSQNVQADNEDQAENCVDQQSLTTFVESDSLQLDGAEISAFADSADSYKSTDSYPKNLSNFGLATTHVKLNIHNFFVKPTLKPILSDSEIKTKIGQLCSRQLELLNSAGEELKSCFEQDYETVRRVVQMMINKVPDLEGRLLTGLDDMIKEMEVKYRESFVEYINELLQD